MTRSIINLDELELLPLPPGLAATGDAAERYDPRVAMVGAQIGAARLGYNVIALAPGKRAFPFHSHRTNEEMFFVISGIGEIRIGDARHAIRAGDIIACPPGGPETAHQIINTSDAELRYLALSTKFSPDIVEYPDSGKYSVMDDYGVGADGQPRGFRAVGRQAEVIDYWEGE